MDWIHVKDWVLQRFLVSTVTNLWLIKGHSGLAERLLASQKRFFSTELVGQHLPYVKTLLGHTVFNTAIMSPVKLGWKPCFNVFKWLKIYLTYIHNEICKIQIHLFHSRLLSYGTLLGVYEICRFHDDESSYFGPPDYTSETRLKTEILTLWLPFEPTNELYTFICLILNTDTSILYMLIAWFSPNSVWTVCHWRSRSWQFPTCH